MHVTYWFTKCVTKLCDSPDWLIQTCHQFARVRASGCHCRKMQRNKKFGAKISIWRQLLAKKIAGENFCLALERHLPLKVIDSCRPCITSHNSVADGVKPEHDASHTSDICLVVNACVGLNQKLHHYVSLKPLFDLAMCDVFSKMF